MRRREVRSKLLIIIIAVALLLIAFSYYYYEQEEPEPVKYSADQQTSNLVIDSGDTSIKVLEDSQQSDGSWNNDMQVTQMASIGLANSGDQDGDGNHDRGVRIWTRRNYDPNASIMTQSLILNNIKARSFCNVSLPEMDDVSFQATNAIVDKQMDDGSWEGNPEQTGIAIYGLKASDTVDDEVTEQGQDWLMSHRNGDTWGDTKTDSFAVIALENSIYDTKPIADNIVHRQSFNGSFGDIETTAWAVIALSRLNDEEYRGPSTEALSWLKDQETTLEETALISMATYEFRCGNSGASVEPPDPDREREAPMQLFILIPIIGGGTIILLVLFNRLTIKNVLDGTRKQVYKQIKDHPGVCQNELMRSLNISSSSIRHHLRVLNKYDYIFIYDDGRYNRYYVQNDGHFQQVNNGVKMVVSLLRRTNTSDIVRFIRDHPSTTQGTIAKALNLHPSTVHWHTKQLIDSNVLDSERVGKKIHYIVKDPIEIDKLLKIAV